MRAFKGFVVIVEPVFIQIFVFALFTLHKLEVRAIEEGKGVDKHHSRKDALEDLEQEVSIEPVRAEANGFDVPTQRARFGE